MAETHLLGSSPTLERPHAGKGYPPMTSNYLNDKAFSDGFKTGQGAPANDRHRRAPSGMNEARQLCWVQGYQEGFSARHDAQAAPANIWHHRVMDN